MATASSTSDVTERAKLTERLLRVLREAERPLDAKTGGDGIIFLDILERTRIECRLLLCQDHHATFVGQTTPLSSMSVVSSDQFQQLLQSFPDRFVQQWVEQVFVERVQSRFVGFALFELGEELIDCQG